MLKAAFIGFGRMGITHFSILNSHPRVKTTSICDQSSTMLKIANKYTDISVYSDYREMLAKEDVHFVVVSTPTGSHAEIIQAVVPRGIHIFAEKPLSLSPSESTDIVAALKGTSIVNQIGYVNRFNEVFETVRDLVLKGLIGEIKTFRSDMFGATVLHGSGGTWRGEKKAGGGCLYEFASHNIDLVNYLLGPPDYVSGSVMQSIFSKNVEDLVSTTFHYANGVTGQVTANWSDETFRKPANIVTLFGTKGKLIANKHEYKVYLREPDPENGFEHGWNTRYITEFSKSVRFYLRGNEFTRQLDHFIESIKTGRTSGDYDFSKALETDIVMDQIIRDAAESGPRYSTLAPPSPPLKRKSSFSLRNLLKRQYKKGLLQSR